jgi:hypothetical protein
MTQDYSIYAVSENGTKTVDFVDTKKDAEKIVNDLTERLKNGTFVNETSLDEIIEFDFDQMG